MVKYKVAGMVITAHDMGAFCIDFGRAMTRQEMEEIRSAIDGLLNTSAEELEASGE